MRCVNRLPRGQSYVDENARMIAGVPIKTEAERGGNEKDQSVGGAQDQASVLDVEMPAKFVFPIVVVYLLVACRPTEAWYKQTAGPSYYSVGRASGLLSGIRRSPYVRRAEPDPSDSDELVTDNAFPEFTAQNFILKSMHVCIKDISPDLQSCELLQEIKGSFKCKADVFLTLDSADCAGD